MKNLNDKSMFFLTLSLICVWVILDNVYGQKYLDTFLSNVFDFYNKKDTEKTTATEIASVARQILNPSEEVKQETINKNDENDDGKLSLKEFIKSMPSITEYKTVLGISTEKKTEEEKKQQIIDNIPIYRW